MIEGDVAFCLVGSLTALAFEAGEQWRTQYIANEQREAIPYSHQYATARRPGGATA
jgi:hypothetical protein